MKANFYLISYFSLLNERVEHIHFFNFEYALEYAKTCLKANDKNICLLAININFDDLGFYDIDIQELNIDEY